MESIPFADLGLASARDKVLAGERLSLDEGLALLECPDPHALQALAWAARERRHGDRAHYVVNRHVNPTNICVNRCRFCAYRRDEGQKGAYVLTPDEAMAKLADAGPLDEVHIVGGCHPSLGLDYYLDLARRVRAAYPRASIKALTAVEVEHLARLSGLDVPVVLAALREAGVDMLPGGGAEIFADAARRTLCPEKLSGEGWLQVMAQAHEAGLRSNATMLFGHVETPRERLEHLDALRRQQDATGGFVCFIPLPYLPGNNPLGAEAQGPQAMDVLRTVAVSRLMLDNFPHIKAYWVMLGLKLAQLCLSWGADDLDGTVVEEKIGHEAGSESSQALTTAQLEEAIRASGFTPVRRDGLFRAAHDGNAPASAGKEAPHA
ncbi:Aminodeoxyfutalosine synthase [Fundidesulfovibrio magnetotacticus]|uniref:Aminodeoxyfutalosine synthase n=1 Tax=Fundidesulfovibrio magnetotacticus TaxID=2730080 RepID=A0A6V8M1R8_9BACT|nr:aminofutalosine synthase MqnE [Fundidesulfovibrio magnetotacticus]GFK95886.1 Aminodeoxyfutalosine synthase [Fundidesulfovibrio magnetotacticus]